MKKQIINIKDEFIRNSTPGIGRVTLDINLDIKKHLNEINTALWLKILLEEILKFYKNIVNVIYHILILNGIIYFGN